MKRLLKALSSVALLAILVGATFTGTTVTFGNFTPSIQPIGDSITQGVGSSSVAGWRSGLYSLALAAGGTQVFHFVGSQTTNINGFTVNPNHEGHSGYVVRQGTAFSSLIDVSNTDIPLFGPDIVILFGGTNDLDPAVNNDSPATLATSLSTWLDATWSLIANKKYARIIVFDLLKRLDATDSKVVTYNGLIQGVLNGKAYASHLCMIDIYAAIPNPAIGVNMNDAVHPNDVGYPFLASTAQASSCWRSTTTAGRPN